MGAICTWLRISHHKVLALGDGTNDLDMATYAGLKPDAALRSTCAVALHDLDGLPMAVDAPHKQAN